MLIWILLASGLRVPLGLDAHIPSPAENPLTEEKVALGRKLFFDTRLSRDGTLSCAGCHDPKRAFTDGKPLAIGVSGRVGTRRTPAILNRAWGRSFFWDGRAATLEEQVLQPISNPTEMDLTLEEALKRVGLERQILADALASYVRTILAGDSPYDRYLAGDRKALSEEAQLGLRVFRGKGNCTSCHLGPNLTDERFHNTGSAWQDGRLTDEGRGAGAFKTPSLRQVEQAAPYMHNGSLRTLEEVVEFYDRGGVPNAHLDAEIRPLGLTADEKRGLVEFLRSLTGRVQEGW